MPEKVIIIGSGPAAWTAAIYAARANLSPLVFEGAITEENRVAGTLPLGQLALTTEVENYPGFPVGDLNGYLDNSIEKTRREMMAPHAKEGVSGPELMELMRQQASNFGTRVITEDVTKIDLSRRPFTMQVSDGKTYRAEAVIVATGAKANYLGLPSEEAYKNRGVSACAVCDGALPRFRNKPLAVIGGGDSAVEEADYLSKFGSVVYMVHRRDELRASKIMADRAIHNPKIEVLWNRTLKEVLGEDQKGVTGVRLESTVGEPEATHDVSGVFLA
ncbi:MAG: FAD-dependent oxidoreductase, partial [Planctomycetota bacterium]